MPFWLSPQPRKEGVKLLLGKWLEVIVETFLDERDGLTARRSKGCIFLYETLRESSEFLAHTQLHLHPYKKRQEPSPILIGKLNGIDGLVWEASACENCPCNPTSVDCATFAEMPLWNKRPRHFSDLHSLGVN